MLKKLNHTRVVAAAAIGTIFEWYDFLIFGAATALVFNKIFFPNTDPFVGVLVAIMISSVGWFARPLGGIIFGHVGDRLGRKNTLMATMLIMGVATFVIGLIPAYAQWGIWAAVALVTLRIVQGIAFGGEWAGASLMIIEHAPENRKAFYTSFMQIGFPIGVMSSAGIYALLTQLSPEDFISWGWRIPFLLSIVLVIIGTYIRSKLSETPVFEELQAKKQIVRSPLLSVIRTDFKNIILGTGIKIAEVSWALTLTIVSVAYMVNTLKIPRPEIMNSVFIGAAIMAITMPIFGWLGDKYSRRTLYLIGAALTVLVAYPVWALMGAGHITLAMTLGLVVEGIMMAQLSAFLPQLFKANVRYTGSSLCNQIGGAIGGGIVPATSLWLAANHGGLPAIGWTMVGLGAVTLVATYFAKEIVES
jgi:MHS family shikimate/dehydroshikimate transporter-like MFS transporter